MRIEAKLTAEDYIQAQFLHIRPRLFFKWVGIIVVSMGVVVAGVSTWDCLRGDGRYSVPVVIFISLAYLVIWFGWVLPRRARKIFNQQKLLQETVKLEITPEGFVGESACGTSNVKWTSLHRYKVGKNLILVYQSDIIFLMFPRRWFETDSDWKLFQDSLGKTIKKAK